MLGGCHCQLNTKCKKLCILAFPGLYICFCNNKFGGRFDSSVISGVCWFH